MGCDIHLIVEHRNGDGVWHRVPHFDRPCEWCDGTGSECYSCKGAGHNIQRHYSDRNYNVFGILANVRNGYGFAGVDTGDGYKPLTDGRGLPTDLSPEQMAYRDDEDLIDWASADWQANDYDLGEHSFTWLLYSELLDESYWQRTTKHRGVVGAKEYETWKRESSPNSWSGFVAGGSIKHITHGEMEARIESGLTEDCYTLVEWETTYRDDAKNFLKRIAETVDRIGNPAPEDVRLVMGFDS